MSLNYITGIQKGWKKKKETLQNGTKEDLGKRRRPLSYEGGGDKEEGRKKRASASQPSGNVTDSRQTQKSQIMYMKSTEGRDEDGDSQKKRKLRLESVKCPWRVLGYHGVANVPQLLAPLI